MPPSRHFYCEACGAEVSSGSTRCSACGVSFTAVRCPRCGFEGAASWFEGGCPDCGYSQDPPGALKEEQPPPVPGPPKKTSASVVDWPVRRFLILSVAVLTALGLLLFFYGR